MAEAVKVGSVPDAQPAESTEVVKSRVRAPMYAHRRTDGEVRRCKKGERTDLKVHEWNKFQYFKSDVLTRPIVYDKQTVPIPRVRASEITPETFFKTVAAANQPVIIEAACSHWPAMERWSPTKLEERFRHTAFKVGSDKKGRKLRLKMKYFLDYMRHQQDDSPLYLFETGVDTNTDMSSLKEDYKVPDFFPHDWLGLMNRESRPPHRWWCIGPRRSGTTVHIDPLGTSAWNAVTHGTKRWVLFEPNASKRVVKGKDVIKKDEDDEAVMYFDFILPRIKEAHPDLRVYEGLQNAGDIIFVPGDWWHGVLNQEDCIAVTENYVGPDNFENCWTHTRKEREKVASLWYRNMQKFAPEVCSWANELNARDGFRMRHERRPGEKLPGAKSGSSSDSSSSDSSSDEDGEIVRPTPSGIKAALEGAEEAASAPRKRRRSQTGWDSETVPTEVLTHTEAARRVASPMKGPPGGRDDSPRPRKQRATIDSKDQEPGCDNTHVGESRSQAHSVEAPSHQ